MPTVPPVERCGKEGKCLGDAVVRRIGGNGTDVEIDAIPKVRHIGVRQNSGRDPQDDISHIVVRPPTVGKACRIGCGLAARIMRERAESFLALQAESVATLRSTRRSSASASLVFPEPHTAGPGAYRSKAFTRSSRFVVGKGVPNTVLIATVTAGLQ